MKKPKGREYISMYTRIAKDALERGINPLKATFHLERMKPFTIDPKYVFEALRLQGEICKYVFESTKPKTRTT
jgi:hypothetical protein